MSLADFEHVNFTDQKSQVSQLLVSIKSIIWLSDKSNKDFDSGFIPKHFNSVVTS